MKRLLYSFLIFLLAISLFSKPIFASSNSEETEEKTDISGYDNWSFSEKSTFWVTNLMALLGAHANLYFGGDAGSYKRTVEDVFYDMSFASNYDSYGDFLASKVTTNSNGELVYDDDVLTFLNAVLDRLKTENTYQYGYLPPNADLPVNSFNTKSAYAISSALIAKYPDKAFRFNTGNFGGWLDDVESPDLHYAGGWTITVYDIPYGAVGNVTGIGSNPNAVTQVNGYNDEWQLIFDSAFEIYLVDWNNYGFLFFYDSEGNYHKVDKAGDVTSTCIDDALAYPTRQINKKFNSGLGFSPNYFSSHDPQLNMFLFSNYNGGIPVFNSLADLKEGTEGKNPLQTMPGYTGQPITKNTISQTEINDFSTNYNYYYGDNSGNNPGGGGSGSGSDSSGGNWLESLLSSLGKLGDIIMTLLSKVFDIITDILKFFTDTLADVMDIIPDGFIGFLGAFFPFIPKEWLTAVSLLLALTLIGAVIKFFKK